MTPEELLSFKLELVKRIAHRLFPEYPQLTVADVALPVANRLLGYDLTDADVETYKRQGGSEKVARMIDEIVAGVKADLGMNEEEQMADCPQEEPSSGNWMWDEIREHLPPHMRNDPEVARHIATLMGLGMGEILGGVLYFLNRFLRR